MGFGKRRKKKKKLVLTNVRLAPDWLFFRGGRAELGAAAAAGQRCGLPSLALFSAERYATCVSRIESRPKNLHRFCVSRLSRFYPRGFETLESKLAMLVVKRPVGHRRGWYS